MAKMSIADAMKKSHGNPPGPDSSNNYEGDEQEAYVGDLQEALDSGDGQALYDTICAIMAAKSGAEHSPKK